MDSLKTKSANAETTVAEWWHVDADGIVLGRMAAKIAAILRGKHKPQFTPHVDCGDHVVVVNASKVHLTGQKLENKVFYWADTRIEGNTVVLSSDKVAKPVLVQYAWAAYRPWANLFNQDGLPALPFRTDQ